MTTDESGIPKLTIAMVGARGVGKTSLLAAMYNELREELRDLGCTFTVALGPTQRAINKRLTELKKVASGSGVVVQTGEGISGTSQEERYRFDLDVGDGGDPEVIIEFVDMPGGWYEGTGDYQRANEILKNSAISFVAVDATALMEPMSRWHPTREGEYHDEINAPLAITQAYENAQIGADHCVILTLIRAETYVNRGKIEELIEMAKSAYKHLAKTLATRAIPVIGCYVETVGSLYFVSFEKDGDIISSSFRRDPRKGYAPSRCAIPLRIAMHNAFVEAANKAADDIEKESSFWTELVAIFTENELTRRREKYVLVMEKLAKLYKKLDDNDYFYLLEQ